MVQQLKQQQQLVRTIKMETLVQHVIVYATLPMVAHRLSCQRTLSTQAPLISPRFHRQTTCNHS